MAYDGMYGELSTRGSTNEVLNAALQVQSDIEDLTELNQSILDSVMAYQLAAVYKFLDVTASGTYTVALELASVFRITMTSSGAFSILLSDAGLTEPNQAKQVTLILKQGVGATTVTWPTNVVWANGNPPILSFTAGKEDVVTLLHITDEDKWYGFFNGSSF